MRFRDDTLRFFLYASGEDKIPRLIFQGKEGDAETLVDTVDRERAAFIKRYFHAKWPNRSIYHAMINTVSGNETVIQVILSFLPASAKGVGKPHTKMLQELLPKGGTRPQFMQRWDRRPC